MQSAETPKDPRDGGIARRDKSMKSFTRVDGKRVETTMLTNEGVEER